MSRLTCRLSGVTYVVDSDTSGRATPPRHPCWLAPRGTAVGGASLGYGDDDDTGDAVASGGSVAAGAGDGDAVGGDVGSGVGDGAGVPVASGPGDGALVGADVGSGVEVPPADGSGVAPGVAPGSVDGEAAEVGATV